MRELLGIVLFIGALTVITQPERLGKWWAEVESGRAAVLCAPQPQSAQVRP